MPDPTRLFAPIRLKKERWPRTLSNFILLPGPSAFLSGQRGLGALPLTPAAVAVLADQLIEAEDVAGPLLVGASLSEPAAIATLWQPYVRGPAGAETLCLEGSNVCGFFEEAAIVSWVQFENDLPVLATHPMAQRLRALRVRDEPSFFTPAPERLARVRANLETAIERVKPHFTVTFMGHPLGR